MPLTAPGARIHVGVLRSVSTMVSGACRLGQAYTCRVKPVVPSSNSSKREVLCTASWIIEMSLPDRSAPSVTF
jgi:hypothetical protein